MGARKKRRVKAMKQTINPTDHWGLVYRVARKFLWHGMDLEDLAQEGMMGVIRAIKTYDPEKAAFSTYAARWIYACIQRAVFNKARLIRIPVVRFDTLRKAGQLPPHPVSLDGPRPDHEAGSLETLHSAVGDTAPSPEEHAADAEEQQIVRRAVEQLTPREQHILRLRFEEDKTLEEAGKAIGRTRERVRQIEAKALEKLRPRLEKALS